MKNTLNLKKIQLTATQLSNATEGQRDLFLKFLSKTLIERQSKIIEANKKDVNASKKKGLPSAFIERLVLDEKAIQLLVLKLENIAKLQSHLGKVVEENSDEQGLTIKKVRVPLGVIAIIYEARPEVTIDVAALCVKSGNAVILKGGSEAVETNKILYHCILAALEKAGFAREVVSFISSSDRKITDNLLKQHKYIDLVIARGGYELARSVLHKSMIPVLAHAAGGARIYIDKSADTFLAQKIIINAKTSKPSACNSIDTIVVHKDIANDFISDITNALKKANVEVMSNEDWDKEFLGLSINIKIVKDIDEAISFINEHSKKHSEGIIATDKNVIEQFMNSVDSAALFANCSTRFHDGYVFGLGSEMGISTSKLHARGPVGLKELMTYKWEVYGNGHIR
ncbi:glutamate-5-semialdehyde dehydrogenase [Candidatus Gottesmanbacteria bacterium]|nr:glutamate-5-semialdehyde dehydrogenase [Candidatus Gottesmanbacteria bacterium]